MELGQLVVTGASLKSRVVRNLIGERTIDIFSALARETGGTDPDGGIIPFLLNSASKLVGFLFVEAFKAAGFILGSLVRWFAEGILYLYNFDWNQTNKALQDEIEANNVAVIAAVGAAVGTGAVWLGSMAIAGLATTKFPVVAGHVLIKLAEEGGDEIRAQVYGVIESVKNNLIANATINTILTARQIKLLNTPDPAKRSEPWTISGAIDKSIESVTGPALKAFLTGFKASAEDAFFEALYVVSYGIEEGFAAARAASKIYQGTEKLIELTPDKTIPDERIIIRGNSTGVKQQTMALLANHSLIKNRDVGQYVGIPLPDYIRANPFVRKAQIVFKSKEAPPYRRYGGDDAIKGATYSIPDLKPGVTWAQMKAAGKRFLWGKYRATANLSNARQMAVYGASPGEAESKLRELLTLSTAEILTLSITEEKDRHVKNRKTAMMMYPAYFTVTVRRPDLDDPQLVTLDGKGYSPTTTRYDIWRDTIPEDFEVIP